MNGAQTRCRGYQRLTKTAEALIASVYLSGTNTRRVKRALFALFQGGCRQRRRQPRLAQGEDRPGTPGAPAALLMRTSFGSSLTAPSSRRVLSRKAQNISVLAAIGVRRDGQKVLLSIMNMGGESTAAWRQFIDDLDARGLKRPEFVMVDGAPGLEAALVALWGQDLPIQRCTVHKHRNLLAHAPKHMHEELGDDYRAMIYAETAMKLRSSANPFYANGGSSAERSQTALKRPGIGCSPSPASIRRQWKSARTTNAIERLTRSFAAGSKHRPCCPALQPCRCCFGRSSPQAKSRCARSTAGKRSRNQLNQ